MKREFLKGLGIADDLIDKIMDENGKDINTAKATLQAEIDKQKGDIEAHKSQAADWQAKYDTISQAHKDYDVLKKFHDDAIAKQTEQRHAEWLKGRGCKHPELFVNQIDWSKATYDEDKKDYAGLDVTIKNFKNNYADMFEQEGAQTVNPAQGNPASPDSGFMERYKAENPDMARFIK